MNVGFLFPGQGADLAAVAGDWAAASADVRRYVEMAAHACEVPAATLLHGSGLALRATRAYQPALVAVCLGALREVEACHGTAAVVAGHSLGELVAAVAAGALSDERAVAIAATRGALMGREAAHHPGGMLALRTDEPGAHEALAIASTGGRATIAAHNAPDEWVLSGDLSALRLVPARFAPTPLATEGAWHSHAMAGARAEFEAALAPLVRPPRDAEWIANRTGDVVAPDTDVAALLAGQLVAPVQWCRSLERIRTLGVRTVVTIGPARALRSQVSRTLGDAVQVIAIERPKDLTHLKEALPA